MAEGIRCYDGTKIKLDKKWHQKVDRILKEVLIKIKPSEEEQKRLLSEANSFCNTLQKMLGKKAKVQLAGSLAKGTNLE